MRHHHAFTRAAALLLPFCSSCFAQSPCSVSVVRGAWGWQGHGTAMMNVPGNTTPVPVPFASLGIMEIDYQGRFTARGSISVGGQVQDFDANTGSIQVYPDCTASETNTISGLAGAGRLIILDNGNEMRELPTTHQLGPAAALAHFRRLEQGYQGPRCSAGMVRGSYAGPREGTQMMPAPGQSQPVPVPFTAIHTVTFQYGGAGTATSTVSMGGAIVDFEFPNVSIAVNPDCSATMKYTGTSKQFPGQTFTGAVKYIVLNHGDELIGMDAEASTGLPGIVLDNLKRISIVPIVPDR